jgi:lipoprotein-anchoring transpeptidase ErfK/SrfK
MRAFRSAIVLAAAVAALATACGGSSGADDPTVQTTGDTSAGVAAGETPVPGAPALVARSAAPVDVSPEPDAAPTMTLAATTGFGSPRALLVVQDEGDWMQVALPERPNGSTGWIRADAVEVHEVDHVIDIDLTARTLTLYDQGESVLTTPVAIGTSDAPTPTGSFFVVDKLASADPGGAYGPYAFGLSAHSETLTEFAGGDGQVGIHGTNDPASIGQAVSHGCIRVPNTVAETLNQVLALGTPVTIH